VVRPRAKVHESAARRIAVKALSEESLVAELDALAEASHTSRSEVLRRIARRCLEEPNAGDQNWRCNDHRMLLAEYGPEDEGLYDGPEGLGATRAVEA
jgi:AraC-like DNA-binding protein